MCTFWGIDQPRKIVQASATSALLPVSHAASCKTLSSGTETRPKDGDLAETSRWSCSPKLGGECTISYDLGEEYSFQELRLGEAEATDQLLLYTSLSLIYQPTFWGSSLRIGPIAGFCVGSRSMPDELDTGHGHTHAHLARRFELHVDEIFVVSITTIYPPPQNAAF